MNNLKEIDILDKSKLALSNLFDNTITLKDSKTTFDNNQVDGILAINSTELSFIVIAKPTIGRISKIIKDYELNPDYKKKPIIITDYATEDLMKYFREQGIFFIDSVGNCFIDLPHFKILVEGRDNIFQEVNTKRAFQKTGLKLLFYLFKKPDLLNETYRKIAEKTKISLGSIANIFDELKADGFIVERNNHKKHLSNLKLLLTKWAISYTEVLRPSLHRGYFTPIDLDDQKRWFVDNKEGDLFLGGEFGAYYLDRYLKPERLIIYSNIRLSELAKTYKIVPASKLAIERNRIEVLEKFWVDDFDNNLLDYYNSLGNQIVDPILIYADLIVSNNYRNVETAEAILDNELRDRFKRYNLQW